MMDKKELLKTAYKNVCDEYTNNKRIMRNESCTILYHLMDDYNLQLQDIADLLGYDIAVMEDVLDTKPYHSFYTEVDDQIRILEKQIKDGKCNEILNLIKEEREPKYLSKEVFNGLLSSSSFTDINHLFTIVLPIHKTITLMVNSRCQKATALERSVEFEQLFKAYLAKRYNFTANEILSIALSLWDIMNYEIINLDNVALLSKKECDFLEDLYSQIVPDLVIDWDKLQAGYYDDLIALQDEGKCDTNETTETSNQKEVDTVSEDPVCVRVMSENNGANRNDDDDDDECFNCEDHDCFFNPSHDDDDDDDEDYYDDDYYDDDDDDDDDDVSIQKNKDKICEDLIANLNELFNKTPEELDELIKSNKDKLNKICKDYNFNLDLSDITKHIKNGGAIIGAYVNGSKDYEELKNFIQKLKF